MTPLIVGLGGTMRFGSSSSRALQIAIDAARARGAETRVILGPQLDFPMYDVGVDLSAAATAFVETVAAADGLIIASPSYHGGVSGLLKNALDHLEELRGGTRPYLRGRAVGLIATGDGWQGPNATLQTMRQMVHTLQGWPTPLGIAQNVAEDGVEPVRGQLEIMAGQVVDFATVFSRVRA